MKSLIISYSDMSGGAARAAFRLNDALNRSETNSSMLVREKLTNSDSVFQFGNKFQKFLGAYRIYFGNLISKLQSTENYNYHSGNYLPSNLSDEINRSLFKIVNLHWVSGEMMSIKDISRITKPIVWTLHDMWPFCGSEHYTFSSEMDVRWKLGYTSNNKLKSSKGFDLDKCVWDKKFKYLNKKIFFVSPSHWLANEIKKSLLFKDSNFEVIPNPINCNVFKPYDKKYARRYFNLPQGKFIITTGAIDFGKDKRKGFEHFIKLLGLFNDHPDQDQFHFVIIGQRRPEYFPYEKLSISWLGHIENDDVMSIAYSSAEILFLPSIQENLPQLATESISCGTPVLAFDLYGMPDAVINNETGFLLKPFLINEIFDLIFSLKQNNVLLSQLSVNSRNYSLQNWDEKVISIKYSSLFDKLIQAHNIENS
jgi:glycosyltransferase involved in cell wall biosynthesis